ncbi:hypothetical protein [Nonomuraea diastatica]|uniref:Uncharacterized protein n=1 Tax=Nonomuraea diastatica TaxID=1848329 RepID=A0A4R4VGD1_9ACTN|nr:hypothetical protein [Nonomuraea diastatica]TDD01204.1 hypothetical protein E1294_51680 [Nonomuraea diastatica]
MPDVPRLPNPAALAIGWLTVLIVWEIEQALDLQGPLAAVAALLISCVPAALVARKCRRGAITAFGGRR